jgi:hypothetical protein
MESTHRNDFGLEQVASEMLRLEDVYDLISWKIDRIFVWQAIRSEVFGSLLNTVANGPQNRDSKNIWTRIGNKSKRLFWNGLFLNPYLDFRKTEALVFESGRKEFVDGKYIDVYTKYWCDDLDKKGVSYTIYSIRYPLKKIKECAATNKSLDFITILSENTSRLYKTFFLEADLELVYEIQKAIKENLRVDIDLRSIIDVNLKRFKSQYPLYKWLFKIKKPKNLYLVGSSMHASMIKAAKDCGVVVNELQHGMVTKRGLVANYPKTKEDSLAYFPDHFYIWKDLEMCSAKLPLSKEHIHYFTNKHLEYILKKNKTAIRHLKQVLIISQPYCTNELLDFAIRNAKAMPDWMFVFKTHPVENSAYFITSKPELETCSNIHFVLDEVSIYTLFLESAIAVGVFSTAVFEAAYFGCRVFLLNMPGVEFAEDLIAKNKAELLEKEGNLIDVINRES